MQLTYRDRDTSGTQLDIVSRKAVVSRATDTGSRDGSVLASGCLSHVQVHGADTRCSIKTQYFIPRGVRKHREVSPRYRFMRRRSVRIIAIFPVTALSPFLDAVLAAATVLVNPTTLPFPNIVLVFGWSVTSQPRRPAFVPWLMMRQFNSECWRRYMLRRLSSRAANQNARDDKRNRPQAVNAAHHFGPPRRDSAY